MKNKLRGRIKRQISVVLTLAMMMTLVPMNGFAVEASEDVQITGKSATSSNLSMAGQNDEKANRKATASDADGDLIDDRDLATSADAVEMSEEAISFIARVEALDQEKLLQLVGDYADAWKLYSSMAEMEDVGEAELKSASEACRTAEEELLEAFDEAALYGLYEQIPDEEKAYEKVVLAYVKLEDIKGTLERAMQELLGISSYVNQGYNQVESVVQHDFSQKVVAKGTTIDDVMKLLPKQMKVTLSDGKGNQDKDTTSLMVTWATKDGNDYDGGTEGIYAFYMQLPEGYCWAKGYSPYHLEIKVVEIEEQEVCFWFDSNVDDFDNLTFEISEYGDSSAHGTFIGRGIGNHNGAERQYVKYKLIKDVSYRYICRPYEYRWVDGTVLGGTSEVNIPLERLPYCTVQFEVKKENGDPVTGAAITVTNTGNQTRNISPADEDGTRFYVPVQFQTPVANDGNSIRYSIQAPGYAPVNGVRNFTISDQQQTITIPITMSEKRKVEEAYDRNWDYTADELAIGTPEELAAYSYWVSHTDSDTFFMNKKVVLTADIDISGIIWEPIGSRLAAVGEFDGQGHTVTIDMSTLYVGKNGYHFGGLFGWPALSSIENLNVDGQIRIGGNLNTAIVGGIVSAIGTHKTTVNHCSSNVDIYFDGLPSGSYIGGIIGYAGTSELKNCIYDGDINIAQTSHTYVGGIAGVTLESCTMQQVVSSGNITADNGSAYCGGITGATMSGTPQIAGCSSNMDISANGELVGGIVGQHTDGNVSNAYFNGICVNNQGEPQQAIGSKKDSVSFKSCAYAEGSGHNNSGIAGITCITADMTPEEVLAALNTEGELPWFVYQDGGLMLVEHPLDAIVTRKLSGILYVREGEEASLSVSAESMDGGTLIYQWMRDGQEIAGETASSYTIPNVTSADEGIYSVTIVNQNAREETSEAVDGGSCQLIVVKKGDIQISSGGYQGGWTKDPVTFELSGGLSDYLLGYEYLCSEASEKPGTADSRWSLCEGAQLNQVTASHEGEFSYWFRTRDQAGATGEIEGPIHVKLDRTAPVLEQPVVAKYEADKDQVTVRMSASDSMSGVKEIRYLITKLGETAPSIEQIKSGMLYQSDGVVITGLPVGSQSVVYGVAIDQAGNCSRIEYVEIWIEEEGDEPVRREDTSDHDSGDTGSWVGTNGSSGYIKPNGSRCSSEWFMIDGKWYYFDQEGRMVTGWFFDPTYQAWFYLASDGSMAVGWIQLPDGKWYYLNPVSDGRRGVMYADAWIDGYYLGKDGAWVE